MINPTSFRVPQLNRAFVRGLFWVLLFVFLASFFSIPRGIYDQFLKIPELRTAIVTSQSDIISPDGTWIQRVAVVRNRGNTDAKNVYITITVPNGRITRAAIISDERYSTAPAPGMAKEDSVALSLERLAAGAEVVVTLWAQFPVDTTTPAVKVAATFDGGTAESDDRLTALEEVHSVGDFIARGGRQVWDRLRSSFAVSPLPLDVSRLREPLAFLVVVFVLAWLLLRREMAGMVIAVGTGLFITLYVDFYVSSTWLLIFTFVALIPFTFAKSGRERLVLLFATIIAWLMAVDLWCAGYMLQAGHAWAISACVPYEIPGSIALAYAILVLYLAFTDL